MVKMTKENAAAIILDRIIREESLEYGDLSVQEVYALKKAYCVLYNTSRRKMI